eukprot:TRINITY_DN1722_c0_g2_i1.p1 TRINITY_DN1722_c0_g2~~TRINITY_DN1722_c0_g2_i1.p1  ORF type:complete len:586 (-),score=88.79 TRINITY_DN1722_c0_g2_i1:28-1785(-)
MAMRHFGLVVSLCIVFLLFNRVYIGAEAACDSTTFCTGALLEDIQMAGVFPDSKTFVDMPSLLPAAQLQEAYLQQVPRPATKQQLSDFVKRYFLPASSDVVSVTPVDWKPNPAFLENIVDQKLKLWALDVHSKWQTLVREFNFSAAGPQCDASCYSALPTKRPFVVAGGRFREYYYWDSLWILEGLLISEMFETAKGMLLNFADLVNEYGFIPNGGRVYYLNRSQPPVFTLMVNKYFKSTGDRQLLAAVLPALDKEYAFWMTQRAVTITSNDGRVFVLNIFNVTNSSPRPESYLEDFHTASKLHGSDQQASFYANIASGAETGWDFSTRWMPEFTTSLQLITTNDVIPVDLNSILYAVERTLSQLHTANGDDPKIASQYAMSAQNRKEAINSILWDAESLKWRDFNWKRSSFQHGADQFYASNYLPLWARAAPNISITEADLMVSNDDAALAGFPGGVPTSLVSSGQQWDFPNAWAPLQLFIIESMDHLSEISGSTRASWLSYDLSRRWLISNYCAWEATSKNGTAGDMFEKYDATRVGLPGGGGEYQVQTGFGWTNGVALKLLTKLATSPKNNLMNQLGSITCP